MEIDVSENRHRTIAAPTGAGKSFFVGYMVEELYRQKMPFIIFDTKMKNHIGLLGLKEIRLLKIRPGVRYDWENLVDYPYVLCIPTPKIKTAELISQYRAAIEALYDARKPRTMIIEEAHNYNKNSSYPDPVLELVAREGRDKKINLWFVTQRIQDFPKLLWSQCYFTYLSKFLIPHDIKYVESLIANFSEINKEIAMHDIIVYKHQTAEYEIIPAKEIAEGRKTMHYG